MNCRQLTPLVFLLALLVAGCNQRDSTSGNSNTTSASTSSSGGVFGEDSASFPLQFSVADVTGKPLSLADYRGKVVVVDLWGTWCPPCRMEIPSFVKLQETYGSQGFQMIGLNFENETAAEAQQKVLDFIKKNGINYPCALGTEEIQAQVPDFKGFPTTIFVDKTGQVRAKLLGFHEYDTLEGMVKTLLAE